MARDPYPSETQDRFLLRMPDGMRDRLKAEAEANNRSMNAEIVSRLQKTLDDNWPILAADELYEYLSDPNITYEQILDQMVKQRDWNAQRTTMIVSALQRVGGPWDFKKKIDEISTAVEKTAEPTAPKSRRKLELD